MYYTMPVQSRLKIERRLGVFIQPFNSFLPGFLKLMDGLECSFEQEMWIDAGMG
jgi:hypothetical protein